MSDYGVRYKKIVDYLETHPFPLLRHQNRYLHQIIRVISVFEKETFDRSLVTNRILFGDVIYMSEKSYRSESD
jgi:hypothetical protein